jgi:hypothetical protein
MPVADENSWRPSCLMRDDGFVQFGSELLYGNRASPVNQKQWNAATT